MSSTQTYTLSLHDALPIYLALRPAARISRLATRALVASARRICATGRSARAAPSMTPPVWLLLSRRRARIMSGLLRSEEHTSELQLRQYLVCRLLLEKKTQSVEAEHRVKISRHTGGLRAAVRGHVLRGTGTTVVRCAFRPELAFRCSRSSD